MTSGKTGTIKIETGTASITTITRAKSGNLLVVSFKFFQFKCDINRHYYYFNFVSFY